MTTLRAAFDVSKDSPGGVTTVGWFVGTADVWTKIEERWNAQLALARLSDFHLKNIKSRFPHWTAIVKPFAMITCNSGLRSVAVILNDIEWKSLTHDAAYRKICPHREHACLDLMFNVLEEDGRLQFNNEPMTVVFDNDYGNSKLALRVHDAWCRRNRHPGFNIVFKGSVPWDAVPLQCADMVAGLLRQDQLTRAMLADNVRTFDDNNPVSDHICALSPGRHTLWSLPIARKVEAAQKRTAGASG